MAIRKVDVRLSGIVGQHHSVVITPKTVGHRGFYEMQKYSTRTLFAVDDQVMQQPNAGINASQPEGGDKSLEIRPFGLNLDTQQFEW